MGICGLTLIIKHLINNLENEEISLYFVMHCISMAVMIAHMYFREEKCRRNQ